MDALIFDFDGVLVDSEPLHLRVFREVLAPHNINFTREEYFDRYLGYDDRDALIVAGTDRGRQFTPGDITEMIARKTRRMQELFATVPAMPGAVQLVRATAAAGVPQAVCSGALKDELLVACRAIGVLDCFCAIVSADQVTRSKPDPESYLLTLQRLREATGKAINPARCAAIEDSPAGIVSAHQAGMKVLAVTNSLPAAALTDADRVVDSLEDISPADLENLLS